MSYILEALRKSDQQRQLGAAPKFGSAQFADSGTRPRLPWLYAAGGVALALVAFAIGWLRPWQSEPRSEAAAVVLQTPEASAPARVTARPEPPAAAAASSAPVPAAIPARAEPRTQSIVDSKTVAEARPPKAAIRDRKPAPAKPAEGAPDAPAGEKAKEKARTGAPPDKVLAFSELPAAVRQELPPISVSVHAYSRTPKDRLVGINDKLLHEGDSVTNELLLERITPDGMVFSFKGVRFQRGIQ